MYGLAKIDWSITYEIFHVFVIVSCAFLFINLVIVILIMNFRKNHKIHTIYNTSIKYIIYLIFLVNAISMLLVFISFINLFTGFSSLAHNEEYETREYKLFLRAQWKIVFFSMSLILFFDGFQFPLWYNVVKRVELKTNENIDGSGFVGIV